MAAAALLPLRGPSASLVDPAKAALVGLDLSLLRAGLAAGPGPRGRPLAGALLAVSVSLLLLASSSSPWDLLWLPALRIFLRGLGCFLFWLDGGGGGGGGKSA